jgi:outer membrane protein assembly factor BamA
MRWTATVGLRLGVAAACASSLACSSIPRGRTAVDLVDFEGVRGVSESDLGDKIATTPTPRFLGLFHGFIYDYELFDPYVLQSDLQRIERYYRARGYYQARVRAARVVQVNPKLVRVYVTVEEGDPVLVGEIRALGIQELPARTRKRVERALAGSGLAPGRRFDEDNFAAAEWHIRRALEDAAYAYATVTRSAEVDLPHHRADVTFAVTPDRPATFGAVAIQGLGSLPEGPVRRALHLRRGAWYSASAIETAQQALLDLGVFSSVAIHAEREDPPPPERSVPLTVEVTPAKLRSLAVGGGVELDLIKTDLHGAVQWSDQNFLGGMRRFEIALRPGFVLYPTRLPELQRPEHYLPEEWLHAQLRQPGFPEARTDAYLRGDFNIYPLILSPNVDPSAPVVGYREARGAIGVDRPWRKLYADLGFDVQLNQPFTYVGQTSGLQPIFFTYIDFLTTLDFRDNRIRPHKGFYLGNEFQIAPGYLLGDARDFRVQPQARVYLPIRHATLAVRATTGLVFPANYSPPPTRAPSGAAPGTPVYGEWVRDLQLVYFRGFFSGGPSSNRGYPLYGVGPHGQVPFLTPTIATQQFRNECVAGAATFDAARCALPLGGLTLWEASAELRYPLSTAFEEATFCDASDVEVGTAMYRWRTHLSCGVGLRYETPVGAIRLDVGYRLPGLNPGPDDPDYPGDIVGLPVGVSFGIGEAY